MTKYINVFKLAVVLSFMLCAQSCLVTKKYKAETPNITDQYRGVNVNDSTTIADISWNEFFSDKDLNALISLALDSSLDMRIAIERVTMAESYYKQGKAQYLPSFNVNLQGSEIQTAENNMIFRGIDYQDFNLTGSLSWEADIWGRIRSGKRATEAGMMQSLEELKAVQTTLVANIASNYYKLVSTDAQIELVKQTITNREKSLWAMEELCKAGKINKAGVKQAEAQLHSTKALLLDFNQMQSLLENTINLLVGRNFTNIVRGELENQQLNSNLQTGVPVQLLSNRPDVKAAEFQLINAFEQTNIAKTNFYPSLTISAAGGFQSNDISTWFEPGAMFGNIVAGLTQPIFNKRMNKTQLEVKKAQQEQASLAFEKTLLIASTDVSNALITYNTAIEQYKIKESELAALSLAREYSQDLLTSGYATYLEVLVAQMSELNAQISVIDIQYTELSSMVNLYKSLGGGWK